MKRFLLPAFVTFNFSFLIFNWAFAQSPQGFTFQAVVRDGSGDLVTSSAVGMRISLLQGSASGTAVYVETHALSTNANGLVSLQVGSGSVQSGTFATIDWGNGPYFIKSETDPNGGTNYTISGTQQLMSVPYALYAATSGSSSGGDDLGDHTATENVKLNGNWLSNDGGAEGIRVNDAGLVGIGNSNPEALLHAAGEGRFETGNGMIRVTPTGWRAADRATIKIHSKGNQPAELDMSHTDTGVEYGWQFTARGSGENKDLRIYKRQDLSYSPIMALKYADGNVGIGTTDPGARLEVAGQVKLTGGSPGLGKVLTSDADGLASWITPATGMTNGSAIGNTTYWNGSTWVANSSNIFNNGTNVGIGTNAPVGKLEVGTATTGTAVQDQLSDEAGNIFTAAGGKWQSFTPGISGQLTALAVERGPSAPSTGYTLSIYQGQGTSGTLLHSEVVNIPTSGSLYQIPLTSGPVLTQGTQYTWALNNGSFSLIGFAWASYAGGQGNEQQAGWTADYRFATYMIPTAGLANTGVLVSSTYNVGIGTNAPTAKLHVKGSMKLQDGTQSEGKVLSSSADGTATWQTFSALGVGNLYNLDGALTGSRTMTMNSNSLTFNAEAGHFIYNPTQTGNMGVGKAAPQAILHVNYYETASGGFRSGIIIQNSLVANDNNSDLSFATYADVGGVTRPNARIRAINNGNYGAHITFATKTPGADANQLVERMRISDSGNVGIGTGSFANPSAKLHIVLPTGNNGNPTSNGILVYNEGVGGDDDDAIITAQVSNAGSGDPFFALGVANDGGWSVGLDNSDDDKFKISSSWSDPGTDTRLTIKKSDGNVGIGNTSPAHKLSVSGTGKFTEMLTVDAEGRFETANGIIRLTPTGWRTAERAQLKVYTKAEHPAELDLGQAAGGQELGWQFSARGSSEARKLRIYRRSNDDFFQAVSILHTNGNMGIGADDPAEKLEVDGKVRAKGYICRSGESGSYGNHTFNFFWTGAQLQTWIDGVNLGVTSDRRLKDRITPLTDNAISRVMALRPVDFYYKNVEGTIFTGSDVQQEGFIADELQAVIPSAVTGDKEALTKDGSIQPQTVNVTPIISVLTKAVQEQQALIEEQRAMIEAMRTENGALRNDVNLLKAALEGLENGRIGQANR